MTQLALSAIKECLDTGTHEHGSYAKILKEVGINSYDRQIIQISRILELTDLTDTLWYLQALPPEYDYKKRLLAASFAKRVIWIFEKYFPFYSAPKEAIDAAFLFAEKKISDEALAVAERALDATMYHLTSLPVYRIELRGDPSSAIWHAATAAKSAANKNVDMAVLSSSRNALDAAKSNGKWYERKKIFKTETSKQSELLLYYFGDDQL
jgi:hypothetical protein